MKILGIVSVVVLCLWSWAGAATSPSMFQQSCEKFDRAVGPLNASAEQRALLVVTLATAETQTTDPAELREAFKKVSTSAVELLLSDTSLSWVNDAWSGDSRTTYTYDGSNRLSTATGEYNPGTGWVNFYQALMTYDASSRLLTMANKQWKSGAWVNYMLTTYSSFTAEGFPQTALTQFWTGSAWKDTMRSLYTYSSGHMTTSTFQEWNGASWLNSAKWTYSYDGSWNQTGFLMQTWQSNAWVNVSRSTSVYNAGGDELVNIDQMWNASAWTNMSKDTFTYDGAHHPILDVRSQWFGAFWMDMYNDTMKYSGGLLTEKLTVGILDGSLEREQYSYTAGGNEKLRLTQDWDMVGEAWINVSKDVSVYSGGSTSCCVGTRGNVNMTGIVDLADLSWLIDYLTKTPHVTLPCPDAANVNGTGIIDLADLSILIDYLTIVPHRTLPNCP